MSLKELFTWWDCDCDYFLATNGLCGIQCNCLHGAIATMTLKPMQPTSFWEINFTRNRNRTMWIALKVHSWGLFDVLYHRRFGLFGGGSVGHAAENGGNYTHVRTGTKRRSGKQVHLHVSKNIKTLYLILIWSCPEVYMTTDSGEDVL